MSRGTRLAVTMGLLAVALGGWICLRRGAEETTSPSLGASHSAESIARPAAGSRHERRANDGDPAFHPDVESHLEVAGTLHGTVRDSSGAAVEGAVVTSSPADPEQRPDDVPSLDAATTDAAGRFEIRGVPLIGAWALVASKDGFADSVATQATVDAAHPDGTCELVLRAVARIEVTVMLPSGAPPSRGKARYEADGEYGAADLGADGRCVLEISRPGHCRVVVTTERNPPANAEVECAAGHTVPLTMRLDDGGSIAGLVVDDLGRPIAGAEVRVDGLVGRGETFARYVRTISDGTFVFEGLETHAFDVVASAEGHERVRHPSVDVPSKSLRIVLRRDGRVSLRLRVPSGSPPSGYSVTFVSRETRRSEMTAGDWGDGSLSMALGPGRWLVLVEVRGFAKAAYPIEVAPGAETDVGEILLDPGLTFEGRVEDVDGRPVEGAKVQRAGKTLVTGGDGRFREEHAAADAGSVFIERAGFLDAKETYDLRPGAAPLVVRLRRGGLLKCVVRAPSGAALFLFEFVLFHAEGDHDGKPTARGSAGDDGVWRDREPAGRYRVVASRLDEELGTREVELREGEETVVEFVAGR